ncbi:MAG: agmatinase family protein [Acidobacteria bacterium]|nr:agmatinase family protein [Acidobacteriota bacterium]
MNDPNWPRASAWLAGEHAETILGKVAVIGAPVRLGSITPGRCDLAPEAIRKILHRFSCYDLESDANLQELEAHDFGDLNVAGVKLEDALVPISQIVRSALEKFDAAILLGGDNGVTRPGVHGVSSLLDNCGLLTFDAHFDLRDTGDGLTNGNPVRALLEDGLPGKNIVQIGLQGFANSQAYAKVARDAGISVVTINQMRAQGIEAIVSDALHYLSQQVEIIYVDFDIDVLDRVFAPACPGSRPGGLTPWELRRAAFLCGTHPKVRAIDLVEVDPTQDVADATVFATGACLLSFAAGLIHRLKK